MGNCSGKTTNLKGDNTQGGLTSELALRKKEELQAVLDADGVKREVCVCWFVLCFLENNFWQTHIIHMILITYPHQQFAVTHNFTSFTACTVGGGMNPLSSVFNLKKEGPEPEGQQRQETGVGEMIPNPEDLLL